MEKIEESKTIKDLADALAYTITLFGEIPVQTKYANVCSDCLKTITMVHSELVKLGAINKK